MEPMCEKYILSKKGHIICMLTSFLLLTTASLVNGDDKPWESVPETIYVDLLEAIITQTKANYEKISTWQGEMSIVESDDHYGDNAARDIDQNSPAAKSKHIRRTVTGTIEFAADLANDKLYCNFEPHVEYRAIDLNQIAPLAKEIRYSRMRFIVTPAEYLSYEPNHDFGWDDSILVSKRVSGKAAFRDVPEKAKDRVGDIRDPRDYFNCDGDKKLWEILSDIQKMILENSNIKIAGQLFINIAKAETEGHMLYRITTEYWISKEEEKQKIAKTEWIVDSKVGFNVTEIKTDLFGIPRKWIEITYEKINDTFVPKTIHQIVLDSKGRSTLDSQITFTKSIINQPIPDKTFTYENLGLENGVRFVDNIKRIEYWYKDGKLIPASAKD
ncbi:MAG: hypothetical protein ACTSV7_12640 [Candidatus Baldrarchaeia archaeon]